MADDERAEHRIVSNYPGGAMVCPLTLEGAWFGKRVGVGTIEEHEGVPFLRMDRGGSVGRYGLPREYTPDEYRNAVKGTEAGTLVIHARCALWRDLCTVH